MKSMYLVTSFTNWNTDTSLSNALKNSYVNRVGDQSEIFIVDNNIVTSFSQLSISVKPEFNKDFFALKLVVKSANIPESIKDRFHDLTRLLYSSGLEMIADSMPTFSQEIVEVYAVNLTESKLLTTFNSHENDMQNIEFEIENCDEAYRILNISSAKNNEEVSA